MADVLSAHSGRARDGHRDRIRSSATYGTIYTAGRPPWFNVAGEVPHEAFIIGIAGGSASGKSSVADMIIESMGQQWVCSLAQDSYYKALSPEQMERAHRNDFDFDHPDALDLELLADTLRNLKQGKRVDIPMYDFGTHSRLKDITPMYGASVVVVEGLFVFSTPELRELIDLKVFVDEDADVRLARRMKRDISERGRDLAGVIQQWKRFVEPSFQNHIRPTMIHADLVIPRGVRNEVAMDILNKEVAKQIHSRGLDIRQQLLKRQVDGELARPDSVQVVPTSKRLTELHTVLCDTTSGQDKFVFAADAVMATLFEHVLSVVPHEATVVKAASGLQMPGRKPMKDIAGVAVLRAGLTMEAALGRCVQAVPLGRLLIQTNRVTREPELHDCALPPNIQNSTILLMDPVVVTGAAAMMSVRVLLDHGAAQEDIYLTTMFSSDRGLHAVAYAFPRVNIITTFEHKLDDSFRLDPGIGNFGDRYFGTEP